MTKCVATVGKWKLLADKIKKATRLSHLEIINFDIPKEALTEIINAVAEADSTFKKKTFLDCSGTFNFLPSRALIDTLRHLNIRIGASAMRLYIETVIIINKHKKSELLEKYEAFYLRMMDWFLYGDGKTGIVINDTTTPTYDYVNGTLQLKSSSVSPEGIRKIEACVESFGEELVKEFRQKKFGLKILVKDATPPALETRNTMRSKLKEKDVEILTEAEYNALQKLVIEGIVEIGERRIDVSYWNYEGKEDIWEYLKILQWRFDEVFLACGISEKKLKQIISNCPKKFSPKIVLEFRITKQKKYEDFREIWINQLDRWKKMANEREISLSYGVNKPGTPCRSDVEAKYMRVSGDSSGTFTMQRRDADSEERYMAKVAFYNEMKSLYPDYCVLTNRDDVGLSIP